MTRKEKKRIDRELIFNREEKKKGKEIKREEEKEEEIKTCKERRI